MTRRTPHNIMNYDKLSKQMDAIIAEMASLKASVDHSNDRLAMLENMMHKYDDTPVYTPLDTSLTDMASAESYARIPTREKPSSFMPVDRKSSPGSHSSRWSLPPLADSRASSPVDSAGIARHVASATRGQPGSSTCVDRMSSANLGMCGVVLHSQQPVQLSRKDQQTIDAMVDAHSASVTIRNPFDLIAFDVVALAHFIVETSNQPRQSAFDVRDSFPELVDYHASSPVSHNSRASTPPQLSGHSHNVARSYNPHSTLAGDIPWFCPTYMHQQPIDPHISASAAQLSLSRPLNVQSSCFHSLPPPPSLGYQTSMHFPSSNL
ncbi:hypothetical protein E4T42_02245 [Aureobasidium subglaciale]|nr:hypothetical protein E4T42_02245 [Aureobasidium subglaciale]